MSSSLLFPITITHSFLFLEQEVTEVKDNKQPHAQGDGGDSKKTYETAKETYTGAKETHTEAAETYNRVRAHAAQEYACLEGGLNPVDPVDPVDPVEASRAWAEAVRHGWVIAAEHACVVVRRRAVQYTFSKVLDIAASYSEFTRALTFENFSQSCAVLHLARTPFAGYV